MRVYSIAWNCSHGSAETRRLQDGAGRGVLSSAAPVLIEKLTYGSTGWIFFAF